MSRKDSRGMFANVLGRLDQETPLQAPAKTTSPHLMKVAAGVRQIQEKGEALDRLLRDGDHVIEVDPDEIAPSPIPDRFDGAYDTTAIEAISASTRNGARSLPVDTSDKGRTPPLSDRLRTPSFGRCEKPRH